MALKEKREGSANVEPASEDTSLSRASSGGYLARDDDGEVFKSHVGKGETDYRTVGWWGDLSSRWRGCVADRALQGQGSLPDAQGALLLAQL